jgi:hypothetical protein
LHGIVGCLVTGLDPSVRDAQARERAGYLLRNLGAVSGKQHPQPALSLQVCQHCENPGLAGAGRELQQHPPLRPE